MITAWCLLQRMAVESYNHPSQAAHILVRSTIRGLPCAHGGACAARLYATSKAARAAHSVEV